MPRWRRRTGRDDIDPGVERVWAAGERVDQLQRLSAACAALAQALDEPAYSTCHAQADRLLAAPSAPSQPELTALALSLPASPGYLHPRALDAAGGPDAEQLAALRMLSQASEAALQLRSWGTRDR